jgi:acetamidase/formamidase
MRRHHLKAGARTCHWGFFDATRNPVLTIDSGDQITIDTLSGAPEFVPKSGFHVPPELAEVHAGAERFAGGPHILIGPNIEVRILEVKLRQDWGYNIIRPLAGTLQDDFHETRLMHIPLDEKRNVARLPWALELPLAPFFGIMGAAPPKRWGRITSIVPRAHGGNLDNKELAAGARLFLPIFVEGGLFSCGDGHGAQGDGEVCITTIETALQRTFELIIRDDLAMTYPRAETPTHFVTMGMDPDLDQCATIALRDMIKLLGEMTNLTKEDAYTLCSVAADLRVTQTVNGSKGMHIMLKKSLLRTVN